MACQAGTLSSDLLQAQSCAGYRLLSNTNAADIQRCCHYSDLAISRGVLCSSVDVTRQQYVNRGECSRLCLHWLQVLLVYLASVQVRLLHSCFTWLQTLSNTKHTVQYAVDSLTSSWRCKQVESDIMPCLSLGCARIMQSLLNACAGSRGSLCCGAKYVFGGGVM